MIHHCLLPHSLTLEHAYGLEKMITRGDAALVVGNSGCFTWVHHALAVPDERLLSFLSSEEKKEKAYYSPVPLQTLKHLPNFNVVRARATLLRNPIAHTRLFSWQLAPTACCNLQRPQAP